MAGATPAEWGARWWQWALGAPVDENPVLDATGDDCAVGQSGHVWFLAGTFGGSATRSCTVRTGQALFFPIISDAYIATDETEAFVHNYVTDAADSVDTSLLFAEIDGVSVENLQQYRAHSPTFSVTMPDDNVMGWPAGTYGPSATDGYWLMLAPLPPGEHTLHFGGVLSWGTPLDVTYNLVVEHP